MFLAPYFYLLSRLQGGRNQFESPTRPNLRPRPVFYFHVIVLRGTRRREVKMERGSVNREQAQAAVVFFKEAVDKQTWQDMKVK